MFVISLDGEFDDIVKVIQPATSDLEARIMALEKQLKSMREPLLADTSNPADSEELAISSEDVGEDISTLDQENDTKSHSKNKLKTQSEDSKMKCGGPDEIRTHDPRRVKAMS